MRQLATVDQLVDGGWAHPKAHRDLGYAEQVIGATFEYSKLRGRIWDR